MGFRVENTELQAYAERFYTYLSVNNDGEAARTLERVTTTLKKGGRIGFFLDRLEDCYQNNGGNLETLLTGEQQSNILTALISREMTGIIQLDAANLAAKILPAPALARQLNILENGRRTHHLTKTQSPEIQPPILTSAPSLGGRSLLRAAATRFISSPQTPTLLPSQPNVINAWFNKEFINDTSKNRGINEKVMAIAATRKDESTYAREKTNASVKINTPSDPLPTMIPREMDHTLDNTIILSWVDDLIDQVVAFIPDLSEAGRDEARDAGRWGMVSYVLLVGLIALSRWGEKAVPIAIQRILTSPRLADFFLTTAGRIFKTTLEHWGVKLLHRTTLFFANIGLMMGIDHASQEVDAHLSLEGPLSVSTVSNAAALFLLAGAGNYLNKDR